MVGEECKTIESLDRGLNLTATGKGIMIAFGSAGPVHNRGAALAHQLALARFQFEDAAPKYQAGECAERQTGGAAREVKYAIS